MTPRPSLYISDLDGTLLLPDATLSAYSLQRLNRLLLEGLSFTVASARSIVSMQPILQGLNLSLPVIEFNGAFISDLATGRHEVINSFETAVAEEIYRQICVLGEVPCVSTFNGTEDCLYYDTSTNEGMQWYLTNRQKAKDRRLRHTTNLAAPLTEDVVCFTVIGKPENLSELRTSIQARIKDNAESYFYENDYSPGWYWLTIHPQCATKAQAIQTLIRIYGLDERRLVVFGDQVNDIQMFQSAHRSVAVANAVDELKRHATEITGSNTEDGVVKYIERDWKM
jgi:Cof subfamily protein (haloacid dehalogenase superfamily)